jgi:hypothetical protein
MENIELAKKIRAFLNEFAVLNPNREDDDDEKYTSPDAHQLLYCAECFKKSTIPTRCWSEWGSGGYRPYISKTG